MSEFQIVIDIVLTDSTNAAGNKGIFPPYGIALLQGQIPEKVLGCSTVVRIWDEYCKGPYDVSVSRPDIVMISSLTPGIPHAYRIGAEAQRLRGQGGAFIRVLMGGIHATVLPLEALPYANLIIRGEVTPSFIHFMLERAMRMDHTEHEVWRLGEIPKMISRRPARWDGIDRRKYHFPLGFQDANGCPNNCSFCSVTSVYGSRVRMVAEDCLTREIAGMPPGWVVNYSDNLLPTAADCYIDRSLLIAKTLADHGHKWIGEVTLKTLKSACEKVFWQTGTNLLETYYRLGARAFFFGIETISDKHLAKSLSPPDTIAMIKACKDAGIMTVGSFMIGVDPAETPSYADELLDFVVDQARLDLLVVGIKTPMPGSRMFLDCVRDGTLLHRGWEYYKGENACFRHQTMTPKQLEASLARVATEFYSASSILKRSVLPLLYSRGAWLRGWSPIANLAGNRSANNWYPVYQKHQDDLIVEVPLDPSVIESVDRAFKESPGHPRLFDVRNPHDGISKLF